MSEEQVIEFYYCDNCRHGFQPHEMDNDYEGASYCPDCGYEVSMSTEPWTHEKANELSAMFGW